LAANRTNSKVLAGPARKGFLLQGLLLCGNCGGRLNARYTGNDGVYLIYQCNWKRQEGIPPHDGVNVPSKPFENAIAERLLTAVTPLTIKLALKALMNLEIKAVAAQWRRRIERARYDVDLVARRYEEAGPLCDLQKKFGVGRFSIAALSYFWAPHNFLGGSSRFGGSAMFNRLCTSPGMVDRHAQKVRCWKNIFAILAAVSCETLEP
jgi:hypothetical protein